MARYPRDRKTPCVIDTTNIGTTGTYKLPYLAGNTSHLSWRVTPTGDDMDSPFRP